MREIKHIETVEFEIEMIDDTSTIARYWTRDQVCQAIEKDYIKTMYKRRVIQPSKFPYASPIMLVEKAKGKVQFCIDYCAVNEKTKWWSYPLLRINEILNCLGRSGYFSVINLTNAVWSIPIVITILNSNYWSPTSNAKEHSR